MKHEVDEFGYPTDPEMRRLEFHLGNLAAHFRGARGNQEKQAEIVRLYHATMTELYRLGWDASLDVQSELPDEYMPEEYARLNPPTYSKNLNSWVEGSKFYKDQKKKTEDKEE